MAVSDPFSRDVRASKSPRNAFAIGYSTLFSSPCGLLLPCYVEEVDRGDKLKLGLSNITRTRPVNTSAFMTFDEKVDFWFVPFRLIWSDYENWRIGQNYRHRTTELDNPGEQHLLPHCRYADVASFIRSFTGTASGANFVFQPNLPDVIRMMDLLGYSIPRIDGLIVNLDWKSFYKNNTTADSSTNFVKQIADYYDSISSKVPMNYFKLAAFQCIYMHAYRNEEYV